MAEWDKEKQKYIWRSDMHETEFLRNQSTGNIENESQNPNSKLLTEASQKAFREKITLQEKMKRNLRKPR